MSLSDIITNGMATVDMTQDLLSNPDAFQFYRIDGRVKRKLSQVKKIYPKRREKTNPDKIIHTLLLARTCQKKNSFMPTCFVYAFLCCPSCYRKYKYTLDGFITQSNVSYN